MCHNRIFGPLLICVCRHAKSPFNAFSHGAFVIILFLCQQSITDSRFMLARCRHSLRGYERDACSRGGRPENKSHRAIGMTPASSGKLPVSLFSVCPIHPRCSGNRCERRRSSANESHVHCGTGPRYAAASRLIACRPPRRPRWTVHGLRRRKPN